MMHPFWTGEVHPVSSMTTDPPRRAASWASPDSRHLASFRENPLSLDRIRTTCQINLPVKCLSGNTKLPNTPRTSSPTPNIPPGVSYHEPSTTNSPSSLTYISSWWLCLRLFQCYELVTCLLILLLWPLWCQYHWAKRHLMTLDGVEEMPRLMPKNIAPFR